MFCNRHGDLCVRFGEHVLFMQRYRIINGAGYIVILQRFHDGITFGVHAAILVINMVAYAIFIGSCDAGSGKIFFVGLIYTAAVAVVVIYMPEFYAQNNSL